MEHSEQIHHETQQKIFGITKQIEANENKLKVLPGKREKHPKPELESDTSNNGKDEAKQCRSKTRLESKLCKRKLETEERDELLKKKSRFEEQDTLMEEAEKWMTSLAQNFKERFDAAKKEIEKLETSKAELVQQLKVALAERDEMKISNVGMSCQLKVYERQLKVIESERDELKGEIDNAKKRNLKLEELEGKAERSVTNLSEQLEASERNLMNSQTEKNVLYENIGLLKEQVSLMQAAYEKKESKSETTINNLPLELLDMILQKSYLLYVRGRSCSSQSRNQDIVRKVASVDFCWFQRATKPRFKRTIWRHLKVFYSDNGVRNAICRSNRSYLEQFLRSEDLETCLKSVKCPKDIQARQRRLRNSCKLQNTNSEPRNMNSKDAQFEHQNKNSDFDFLHDVRYFDEARYSSMINCFRQCNQLIIARLAENGGVAVKVEIWECEHCENRDCEKMVQLLVRKLNSIRDKTKTRGSETDRMISQLKSNDIDIFNSLYQFTSADVWIWCKSQTGLAYLQKLYKLNMLADVLGSLSNMSPCFIKDIKLHIDVDQFKKEIVSRSVTVSFVHELDFEERESDQIVGVTKLQNKILVICHSPQTEIYIFMDEDPFCLCEILILELCKNLKPEDIVSSEQHQCVYISDKDSKCIWKLTSKTDNHYEVTKWCNAGSPYTMSVSSDGQLVMVRNDHLRPVLLIYGSDAKLLHSIELPDDIQNPRHAVETSTGNFVILHEWTGISNKMELCISEITRCGEMVLRFIPQNKDQLLGVPYHLSLDSDDRVLVADHWNHRMILLNSNLTWNQTCLIKNKNDEKQRPRRIHYDDKNKQLIVVGNVSLLKAGVNVYDISWK